MNPHSLESRLSFSFSKYERKRKSSSKQLNKSFAKSSSSAYYRRKFDIKKNKSSNKESNQRNDRFILADIFDDLRTECKGDVYDLVPCSINSVRYKRGYKHNIRPRLCLLCKTVTSADLSNIHNVQCSHEQLPSSSFALNTIECGGCKTYMKHRFNRSALNADLDINMYAHHALFSITCAIAKSKFGQCAANMVFVEFVRNQASGVVAIAKVVTISTA
eukprot:CAMPEP_0202726198 /NCGR_PEP_ID=MMETSP1385-20130828/184489_1 /ASSEMBLY_ACC=CAM_ASM_000861 /TAXON_ID=933848 /ORGANISM="Elphidium margaritaceum" /LENGTH=217 /DNA_ID=CAMNT_0049392413 /DNA_START=92 /DNA_END=746 /DNA_ORIENTATION=-